jgi:hypothetical protein
MSDWKTKAKEFREEGFTYRQIHNLIPEIPEGTINKYLAKLKNESFTEDNTEDNTEVNRHIETKTEFVNGTMITTSNMLLEIQNLAEKTPYDIMILHGFDPLAWECMSTSNKAWNGTSKQQGTYTMFSSSVKVKPIEMQLDFEFIKECFNTLKPTKWNIGKMISINKTFASVDLFDVHIGKLAWDEETGNNYDLKIAIDMVKHIIDQNCAYLSTVNPKVIIFPMGNDLFQCDNDNNTTTKGTPQDMDTRPKKIFKEVVDLMFESIGKLSQVAPVKVLLVPGNHDATTSYYLAEVMEKAFMDNPNVEIDTNPKTRKYYLQGNVLIGYSHSDEESKKEREGLMQKEVPELWGKSKYREFHFGHIHIENVEEKNGLKMRWIPSISGTDKWHYGKGYIATDRTSQTFLYDEVKGIIDIKYFK